jgi:hypothetical protein
LPKKHSKRLEAHCREDGKSYPRAWELITKSMGASRDEHGTSKKGCFDQKMRMFSRSFSVKWKDFALFRGKVNKRQWKREIRVK